MINKVFLYSYGGASHLQDCRHNRHLLHCSKALYLLPIYILFQDFDCRPSLLVLEKQSAVNLVPFKYNKSFCLT